MGYNGAMEKYQQIEKNFIESLTNFNYSTKNNAVSTFSQLWMSEKDYEKHYQKRKHLEEVVKDRNDYVLKTFTTLESKEVFFETYALPELWDRVFFSKDDSWAVVIAKNGKILTSYKISSTINKTLEKHIKFLNAKINKIGVSDEFARKINEITKQLRKF